MPLKVRIEVDIFCIDSQKSLSHEMSPSGVIFKDVKNHLHASNYTSSSSSSSSSPPITTPPIIIQPYITPKTSSETEKTSSESSSPRDGLKRWLQGIQGFTLRAIEPSRGSQASSDVIEVRRVAGELRLLQGRRPGCGVLATELHRGGGDSYC